MSTNQTQTCSASVMEYHSQFQQLNVIHNQPPGPNKAYGRGRVIGEQKEELRQSSPYSQAENHTTSDVLLDSAQLLSGTVFGAGECWFLCFKLHHMDVIVTNAEINRFKKIPLSSTPSEPPSLCIAYLGGFRVCCAFSPESRGQVFVVNRYLVDLSPTNDSRVFQKPHQV